MTRPLVINLRGTNGSGKTTLARSLILDRTRVVPLVDYAAPTTRDPARRKVVIGYGDLASQTVVVGSYETACGGLDGIDGFDRQRRAIRVALTIGSDPDNCRTAVAEGVIASTVYGSWAEFDREMQAVGVDFAWCYLTTPLDVCLDRIAQRQRAAGRERLIKTELVADKVKAVTRTRERALADGRLVYDLPYGAEREALAAIVRREGDQYRA